MKSYLRQILLSVLILFFISANAQKKSASVSGQVVDENDAPLANVSVLILGQRTGITTNDSGQFFTEGTRRQGFCFSF